MTGDLSHRVAYLRQVFDAGFAAPVAQMSAEPLDFLGIRIDGELFAIPLSDLAGLEGKRKIVGLPGDEPALLGIAGVRGRLVPVYSLALMLGHAEAGGSRWIAITDHDSPLGFAFGDLDGHLRVSPSDFFASDVNQTAKHVRGTVRLGQEVRHVLDLQSIVAAAAKRPG